MYPRLDNWMLELLEPKERSVAHKRREGAGALIIRVITFHRH